MLSSLLLVLVFAAPPLEAAPAACEAGEPAACRRLAEHLYAGGSPVRDARLVPALEAACAKGAPDACAGLGVVHARGVGRLRDAARAAELLERACAKGSDVACAQQAEEVLRDEEADAKAQAAALARATARCEKRGGNPCVAAAYAYRRGWSVSSDAAKADRLARRGCETGSAAACDLAASMLLERDGEAGARRAVPLLTRACDADVGEACLTLGSLLYAGPGGVKKDVRAAVAFARRACGLGEPAACDFVASSNEGNVSADGSPAFASEDESLRVRRAYCEQGGAEACTQAAHVVAQRARAAGKVEDLEDALGLLQLGCSHGSYEGCSLLTTLVSSATKDCDAGDASQCFVAGFVHTHGVTPWPGAPAVYPVDPAQARAAFEKACAGGQQAACARAAATGR